MTEHKSFKRLVRARMEKTGESYTTARARLLRAEDVDDLNEVWLATSDESIRRRTGRGWEEWFEMLDEWGAASRTHRETARWLAEQQDLHPLAWNVQAIEPATSAPAACVSLGRRTTGSRSPRRGRWRFPSRPCSTRSSTSASVNHARYSSRTAARF
jgi:hypothetical protein